MSAHTEYQTIFHYDKPAFVLVPVEEFERIKPLLARQAIEDAIPQAVVEAHVMRGIPLVRAWREHLGLTQDEVAARAGMKQPALARIEAGSVKPRAATILAIAHAMGLTEEQVSE